MDRDTHALMQHIQAQQSDMVDQVILLADIPSGSKELAGLQAVRHHLKTDFSDFADQIEEHDFQTFTVIDAQGQFRQQTLAPALIIKKRPQCRRRILLVGHMDTVYGPEHPVQHCTFENDNILKGPGVCDMKGGLVVMKTALAAFEASIWTQNLGWDVVINADEELGSPLSSALWSSSLPHYEAAFVYEPALNSAGTFAKNRPGSAKITLVAHGQSAHAGRAFNEGRNAICYLAEIILAIHALNGQRPGVTLNIGTITGGQALNQVPDRAVAQLDIRMKHQRDRLWVQQALEKIRLQFERSGYTLEIHAWFGRPVKTVSSQTKHLFQRIQNIGQMLNLKLQWQNSGGCCDGNNLAAYGIPVIDTMGVCGGMIHTADEFVRLDSLTERAQLSAAILIDFARQGMSL